MPRPLKLTSDDKVLLHRVYSNGPLKVSDSEETASHASQLEAVGLLRSVAAAMEENPSDRYFVLSGAGVCHL